MFILKSKECLSVCGAVGAITVIAAQYGDSHGHNCDAFVPVYEKCQGKSVCSVLASNALCGDPIPNIKKGLSVRYSCDGTHSMDGPSVKHAYCQEDMKIALNCAYL